MAFIELLSRDLRHGLRRLRRAPLFAAFSVGTLALGIGVTTAAYSFVYDQMLRGAGVREPATLLAIRQTDGYQRQFSWPEYRDLVNGQTTFTTVGAYTQFGSGLTGRQSAELVLGEGFSGNFFRMLGVDAERGRVLQPDDDRPGAPDVIVLSDGAWHRQFDGDPAIVGTTVHLAGRVFEVVGVAPPSFHGMSGTFAADLWIPLSQVPGRGGTVRLDLANREQRTLNVVGRLAPGRSVGAAEADLAPIAFRLDAVAPLSRDTGKARRLLLAPAFDNDLFRTQAVPALFVLSIPGLVLLVACTNLMNLVQARGSARQHEFDVRRALGGSRWRIVREELADGAIVAAAGGMGGLLVARALLTYGNAWVRDTFGAWPQFRLESRLEPAVLAVAAGAALLALVVSTLLPALGLTRRRPALTSDVVMSAVPRWRGQSNLIALQVAVSVGLFLVTALAVTAFASVRRDQMRAGLDRVAMVSVPLGLQQRDESRGRAIIDRVVDEMRRTPGVTGVEVSSLTESTNRPMTTIVFLTSPDRPFVSRDDGERNWLTTVTPGAFRMTGTTIRFGRTFDDRDTAAAPPVVIVNASLARKILGRADAVGGQVLARFENGSSRSPESRLLTLVGVTADTYDYAGRVDDTVYVPYAQNFEPNVSFLAEGSTADARALATALRTVVHRVDPDVAISFAGRADLASRWLPGVALGAMTTTLGLLATCALVLAMAGLYGVLSHVVAKRTRELGLRMALGADRGRILRLILRDGFRPVVEGLVIGLAGAIAVRLMLQPSFQKPITAFDPIAFTLAAGPLLVAATIACYLPARRAARVEPNVALRDL